MYVVSVHTVCTYGTSAAAHSQMHSTMHMLCPLKMIVKHEAWGMQIWSADIVVWVVHKEWPGGHLKACVHMSTSVALV